MTFRSALEFPPNQLPLVRVFFSGLIIVKPTPSGDRCEAFIHRTALDHELLIEVRLKRPGRRDSVIMRHLGPLEFARPVPPNPVAEHGMFITTAEAAGIRGYDGSPTTEGESLRLVVDLSDLHRGKTRIANQACRPSILMNDAIFYCAERTESALIVDLQRGGATVDELTPFSTILGANIYSSVVMVEWREKGVLQTLRLERPAADATFEIYIINDPLAEGPPRPGLPVHDELREYYTLLPDVTQPERFNLFFRAVPAVPGAGDEKGSTRNPCMSVIDDS